MKWMFGTLFFLLVSSSVFPQVGKPTKDGRQEFFGMILPSTQTDAFRLRTQYGDLTVQLEKGTDLGVYCFRSLKFEERKIVSTYFPFAIPALGKKTETYPLPKDMFVRRTFPRDTWQREWADTQKTGELRFVDGLFPKLGPHAPERQRPWATIPIEGVVDPEAKRLQYKGMLNGQEFRFGFGVYPQVFGVVGRPDLVPYATEATVSGHFANGFIAADRVAILPVGDSVKHETKDLPRVLFIGDSISIGYNNELRRQLAGKVNLVHPPTNCGPVSKHVRQAPSWLGAYEEPGRGWDVISFNAGHWDTNSTKADYQRKLHEVVAMLKRTGAELIWVTTAPVPRGFEKVGDIGEDGKAGGRRTGVMEHRLNPWAAEVMAKHPEVLIADQWQVVKDGEDTAFKEWWTGNDVHFRGDELNSVLAKVLTERIQEALARRDKRTEPLSPVPPPANWKKMKVDDADEDITLKSSIVDYSKLRGTPLEQAQRRAALAADDLMQHQEWLQKGEIPPEEFEKAQKIFDRAVEAYKRLSAAEKK